MDQLESELKTFCIQAPKWMQIEIQALWYGLISWSITCTEDLVEPTLTKVTIRDFLIHSDGEFEDWPTEWFDATATTFLSLKPTLQQQQDLFEQLDSIFRDCIPVDLNIYSVLADGETLTEDQWDRIYDALAFNNPSNIPKRIVKTHRIHGRRGLTPLRRKKALTRHRLVVNKSD